MISLEQLRIFVDDIWVRFKTHSENVSAHHDKYTDAEAQDLIDTHAGLPSVHHTKTIDASELSAGEINDARIPSGIARDTEVTSAVSDHAGLPSVHHTKTIDASELSAGEINDARIPSGIARDTEVTSAVSDHAGLPSVHHTKYTDAEAVTAIEAEVELDLKLFTSVIMPRSRVYNSANQTLTTNTWTVITWNTAIFNVSPSGWPLWRSATNPSRFTVKYPGLYFVHGYVRFVLDATGVRLVDILLNGSIVEVRVDISAAGDTYPTACVTAILALAEDDYVEMRAYQTSGGDLVVIGNRESSSFMIARLY